MNKLLILTNFKKKPIHKINILKFNKHTYLNIKKLLDQINNTNSNGIFLTINSSSDLNQALLISGLLRTYKKESNSVPIHAFCEDGLSGPALLIYLSASKTYAHECSIFGFYDLFVNKINKENIINKFDIKINYITAGESKVKLNDFKPYKKEDIDWMKRILEKRKEIMVEEVLKCKPEIKSQFSSHEELSNFLGSRIISSNEMIEKGFINEFGTTESIRFKKFPGVIAKEAKEEISIHDILNYKTSIVSSLKNKLNLSFSMRDLVNTGLKEIEESSNSIGFHDEISKLSCEIALIRINI